MRAYLNFCQKYTIEPLPASELTLRYFCTELSHSLSYPTIKVYLAGVRLFHIENHVADPTKEAPLLQYLCTAIRRSKGDKTQTRHPITLPLLRAIKTELSNRESLVSCDKALYWAAFTLAFYGFLRASEYTAPNPTHFKKQLHLLRENVTVNKDAMEVLIKGSKTDQFRKSTTLHLPRLGTDTCPVKAMKTFLRHRKHRSTEPLFTFHNGRFLTRLDVSTMTKSLLARSVKDVSFYSSHSYRIGAATTAAAAGLPDSQIQTLGRWRSGAYKSYIRTSPESLHKATKHMAHQN